MDKKFEDVINRLEKTKVETFDKFTELHGAGEVDLSRRYTNSLFGINQMKVNMLTDDLRLNSGYVLFTRPMLNLTDKNIRNNRILGNLLDQRELSINRYIRCMLDPRLMYNETGIRSKLLDNQQAFIIPLSNYAKSISGGQDRVVPIFASKEGVRKEQYIMVDGTYEFNSAWDINATFRNVEGNMIMKLMYYWAICSTLIAEGMMDRYPDQVLAGELPYTTRVWRLIMDPTLTRVESIMHSGYSILANIPDGQLFDFNSERPFDEANKELQYTFKSVGYERDDDLSLMQFNETTAITNPSFARMLDGKSHNLIKIPRSLLGLYRNRGYPHINLDTKELEWWIPSSWVTPK